MLLDTAVALGLLVSLIWFIGLAIQSVGIFVAAKVPDTSFDFTINLEQFAADPFGAGFWLTAMLLTTLIPTALHMLLAGFGMAVAWRSGDRRHIAWARILSRKSERPEFKDACYQAAKAYTLRCYYFSLPLGMLSLVIFLTPFIAVTYLIKPSPTEFIKDIALHGVQTANYAATQFGWIESSVIEPRAVQAK